MQSKSRKNYDYSRSHYSQHFPNFFILLIKEVLLEPHQTFGIVLRRLRTEKGFSQLNFALECELDRTYISLLERGKRQPSLSTMLKLAKVLNIPASEILREVENLLGQNS